MGKHLSDFQICGSWHVNCRVQRNLCWLLRLPSLQLALHVWQTDGALEQVEASARHGEACEGVVVGARSAHRARQEATHGHPLIGQLRAQVEFAELSELDLRLRAVAKAFALHKDHLVVIVEQEKPVYGGQGSDVATERARDYAKRIVRIERLLDELLVVAVGVEDT